MPEGWNWRDFLLQVFAVHHVAQTSQCMVARAYMALTTIRTKTNTYPAMKSEIPQAISALISGLYQD